MTNLLSTSFNSETDSMTRNQLADSIANEVGIPEDQYSTGQKITFNKPALQMILDAVKGNETGGGSE